MNFAALDALLAPNTTADVAAAKTGFWSSNIESQVVKQLLDNLEIIYAVFSQRIEKLVNE